MDKVSDILTKLRYIYKKNYIQDIYTYNEYIISTLSTMKQYLLYIYKVNIVEVIKPGALTSGQINLLISF